jgi:hypothetical protein
MNKYEEKQILTDAEKTSDNLEGLRHFMWLASGLLVLVGVAMFANESTDMGMAAIGMAILILVRSFMLRVTEAMLNTNRLIAEKLCEDRA